MATITEGNMVTFEMERTASDIIAVTIRSKVNGEAITIKVYEDFTTEDLSIRGLIDDFHRFSQEANGVRYEAEKRHEIHQREANAKLRYQTREGLGYSRNYETKRPTLNDILKPNGPL